MLEESVLEIYRLELQTYWTWPIVINAKPLLHPLSTLTVAAM